MSNIIEIQALSKNYGSLTALDSLSLNIEAGSVVGFIGPNGAGKTTTMRILTTLLQPSSGEAWVKGYSVINEPRKVRQVIGYMPDFFGVYEDMKVWEYLDFFASCYEIPEAGRSGLIDDLLALVELSHKKNEYVDGLSRGMKQRLCLARTLAHDPEVLILDEPASGLDPRARIEIRELLRELKNMGKTIFFSSHILSEVADICNSIAVLEEGKLVVHGTLEDMKRKLMPHRLIRVRVIDRLNELTESLIGSKQILNLKTAPEADLPPETIQFEFSGNDDDLSHLLGSLVQMGLPIVSFSEETHDLEDVFMQVTKGIVS